MSDVINSVVISSSTIEQNKKKRQKAYTEREWTINQGDLERIALGKKSVSSSSAWKLFEPISEQWRHIMVFQYIFFSVILFITCTNVELFPKKHSFYRRHTAFSDLAFARRLLIDSFFVFSLVDSYEWEQFSGAIFDIIHSPDTSRECFVWIGKFPTIWWCRQK